MISVIVCTYNRSNLLGECLDSILNASYISFLNEIIVIDNNSSDQTKELVSHYQNKSSLITYVMEPKVGLSHARNAGVQKAIGKWLLFIDDDGKIENKSLTQVMHTIKHYDFAMFTGIWKAWFRLPAPKWFPFDAGNYVVKGELGIREIGEDYVSGGIMAINKEIFMKEVKSFPSHLGMAGEKIGYGEESYVENLLKHKGYKIGINTDIILDHLVSESKYTIAWHLKAAYQKGFANAHIAKNGSFFSNGLKLLKAFFFGWIRPLGKLILQKDYYRQNFLIDFIGGVQYYLGRLARK